MTQSDRPSLPTPWGEHALSAAEPLALEIGPLRLWARSRNDEVWLAYAPGDWTRSRRDVDPAYRDRPTAPEEEDWVRWPVPAATDGLILSPVFPPRTVVAEPEHSFRLSSGASARVFVRVPLWVRVEATGGRAQQLAELPSVVLSDTWWGTPTEGELCYWLRTTARREARPEVFAPYVAMCPLRLSNRAEEELPVERIALRVAHLSLYHEDGRLWADGTRVRYRGVDEGSDVEVTGRRPQEAGDAVQVGEPQEAPPSRGFRARTFSRLKALPGMGGA